MSNVQIVFKILQIRSSNYQKSEIISKIHIETHVAYKPKQQNKKSANRPKKIDPQNSELDQICVSLIKNAPIFPFLLPPVSNPYPSLP